jgi:hypothetical protein
MRRLLVLLPLLALSACSHPSGSTTTAAPVPAQGKPTAPVAVTAQVSAGAAHVTVTFEADATDVQVSVYGNDGLVIEGEPVLTKGERFARGEGFGAMVPLEAPAGRSALVVTVTGRFNGVKRARVVSFRVGDGALPDGPGEVMTTDDGDTVKVLPAAP